MGTSNFADQVKYFYRERNSPDEKSSPLTQPFAAISSGKRRCECRIFTFNSLFSRISGRLRIVRENAYFFFSNTFTFRTQ